MEVALVESARKQVLGEAVMVGVLGQSMVLKLVYADMKLGFLEREKKDLAKCSGLMQNTLFGLSSLRHFATLSIWKGVILVHFIF